MIDMNQVPEEVKKVLVTQEDQYLILDPHMNLIEFFGTRKLDGKTDMWQIIQEYNNYIFKNKVHVLANKVQQMKEANERLLDEVQYLKWISAEFITILKTKGVDTHAIIRDYKQKREAVEREREHMEAQKISTKIESLK